MAIQREAKRFEEAIISTSTEGGRPGIVLLPGAKAVIDEVRSHPTLDHPLLHPWINASHIVVVMIHKNCSPSPKRSNRHRHHLVLTPFARTDRVCAILAQAHLGHLHICNSPICHSRPHKGWDPYPRRICLFRGRKARQTLPRSLSPRRTKGWSVSRTLYVSSNISFTPVFLSLFCRDHCSPTSRIAVRNVEATILAHRPIAAGIVFEDAPSGVRSGKAAGCTTVALLTTHSRQQLEAANPDYIIKDMSR